MAIRRRLFAPCFISELNARNDGDVEVRGRAAADMSLISKTVLRMQPKIFGSHVVGALHAMSDPRHRSSPGQNKIGNQNAGVGAGAYPSLCDRL
jgi:hypothetical protein